MTDTPFVSIIIPVYNTEKYLSRCIDSVLVQSYSNFELILVDDGSVDNSGMICDDYEKKDSRVRVLHQDNQGVSITRNNGMDAAQGEYINFIDSDDWIEPDYLKVFTETPLSQDKTELPVLDVLHHDAVGNDVYYSGFGALSFSVAKLFKKSIIEDNHIQFPPHVLTAEDTLFIAEYLNHVDDILPIHYLGYHYETNSQGACERLKNEVNTLSVGLIKELEFLDCPNISKLAKDYLEYRTGISFHHFINALYLTKISNSDRIRQITHICKSRPNALTYYPKQYQSDSLIVWLFSHSLFAIGNIIADLSWKNRITKMK